MNAPLERLQGRPPVDPVERCGEIAAAVDYWADKKRQEFEAALSRVARGVFDSGDVCETIRIAGRDLLGSEQLCFVDQQHSGNMSRVTEFRVRP